MNRAYLGTAVAYPTVIDSRGRQATVSDALLIQQSLKIILSTPVGSRFRNRSFGSNVHLLLFEPNDTVLLNLLEYFIEDAIDTWEKRVQYEDVEFTQLPDRIECLISYRIKASNAVDTLIFPFYRELKK